MKALPVAVMLAAWAVWLPAQPSPDSGKTVVTREEFERSLHYLTGTVELPGGMATLQLGPDFRFLVKEDSQRFLESVWGNPPDDAVLGMVVPAQLSPMAYGAWAVVITYEEDGLVNDDEAAQIDYAKLLAVMKQETADLNEERKAQGYPAVELVGWAAPPRYDAAGKKLYWAKELKFADGKENTINYNIRVLGRRGVLVLNAVAGKSQWSKLEQQAPALLPMVSFNQGHRYSDFVPSTDKVATYGIGALVAGKLAAKTGLLKGLVALLMAGKKIVLLLVLALLGAGKWLGARWRRKTLADAPTA